jgi:hypothetical protein
MLPLKLPIDSSLVGKVRNTFGVLVPAVRLTIVEHTMLVLLPLPDRWLINERSRELAEKHIARKVLLWQLVARPSFRHVRL